MLLLIFIKITTILTIIASLTLGVYTLFRNPKAKVHRLWFLTSMAVVVWSVGYLLAITAKQEAEAMMSLTVVYIGATLIPILFFNFSIKFLIKDKKILLFIGYFLAAVSLYLIIFTDYIIKGTRYLQNFGYYEEVNVPIFYFFLIYFLFFIIFSLYLLVKGYINADGIKKRQLLFFTLAIIIGFGGGITNFIMALTGWYPVGQFVVFLYPILITYGIFLPEIKIRM